MPDGEKFLVEWMVRERHVGGKYRRVVHDIVTERGRLYYLAREIPEDTAHHIVQLHNEWLAKGGDGN